jgi:hypothetical protein
MRFAHIRELKHSNQQAAAPMMRKPKDVTGVAVSLKVGDDVSLFALLMANGDRHDG